MTLILFVDKHMKAILRSFGLLCLLAGAWCIYLGIGAQADRHGVFENDNGYYDSWYLSIEEDTCSLVLPSDGNWRLLGMYRPRLEVINTDKPLFFGVADPAQINAYIADTSYTELVKLIVDPEDYEVEQHPGDLLPEEPNSLGYWSTKETGSIGLITEWNSRSESLIVMNEDGSKGLDIDLIIWTDHPFRQNTSWAITYLGGFLILAGLAFLFAMRKGKKPRPVQPNGMPDWLNE